MSRPPGASAAFSLIEVLVTLVIVAIGLFALAGLQAKLQVSEIDAYQRAQALLLLQDMADRIASNRNYAAAYVTGAGRSALGTGDSPAADCTTLASAARDRCEWSTALQGAAETAEDHSLTGAMVGARGCVEGLGSNTYLITVVWQGLTPLSAPSAGLACGAGNYGETDSPCGGDLCRRAVSTVVRIGTLE
jgi:type IV pilus assembly protein PilV